MQPFPLLTLAALATAGALAGCGTTSHTSPPATSAINVATSSVAGSTPYGGRYGAGTAAAAAPTSGPALITTKRGKLGTIVAFGPKHLTVYMFEADQGGASACTGACARFWPPVLGQPEPRGGTISAGLGTIRRADGGTQVTLGGHPLYLFAKDRDSGDTYGEGVVAFGAGWYALRPGGTKVDGS